MVGRTYENRVPLTKLCLSLGLSERAGRDWVKLGKVRAWRTVGVWYVSLAEAERIVELVALRKAQGRDRSTCPVFKTPEMG